MPKEIARRLVGGVWQTVVADEDTGGGGGGGSVPALRWGYDRFIDWKDAGGGDTGGIWHVGIDGRSPQRITADNALYYDSHGSFEPTERRLAVFTRYTNAGPRYYDVYVADTDTGDETILTAGFGAGDGAGAFNGVYSPDGSKIYFGYDSDATVGSVARMNADGTGKEQIIDGADFGPTARVGSDCEVAFSPDGSQFALSVDNSADPDDDGIYVYNADGSGGAKVYQKNTDGASSIWDVSWGKNNRIAFAQQDSGGDSNVWTMKPDGSDLTQVTNTSGAPNWYYVSWSPDGSRLLAATDTPQLVLLDLDGTYAVVPSTTTAYFPRWGTAADNPSWASAAPLAAHIADSSSVDQLRDALIAAGLMSPA